MRFLAVIGGLIVLALVVGLLLAGNPGEPSYQVQAAQDSTAIAKAHAGEVWAWGWLAVKVIGALLAVATLGGLAVALVRWAGKKARTIYPDKAGLFPAVIVKQNEALVDLNRAPAGLVLVGSGRPELPDPSGPGLQVTTQAQAAQALAAATRDGGLNLAAAKLLAKIGRQAPAPAALPEVKISNLEPAHVERLLLEAGENGDDPTDL